MRNIHIYMLALLTILAACSKDETEPVAKSEMDTPYVKFTNEAAMSIPVTDPEKFLPKAFSIQGDTLFVANSHADDMALYVINLKDNSLIGKIKTWKNKGEERNFTDITTQTVNDNYIFVGVRTSNIFVFERKTLTYINTLGDANGNWGSGIYQMVHCYGMSVSGENLIVRDKESIRAYWIYETLTEPSYRIPWIGKVKETEIGYDYNPTIHGMAEYRGKMYITDWYGKSLQMIRPADFKIVFGEETNIKGEVVKFEKLQPVGVTVVGGKPAISSQNSPHVLRINMPEGTVADTVATFANRAVGLMQLSKGHLYFIDQKNSKMMKAEGLTRQ